MSLRNHINETNAKENNDVQELDDDVIKQFKVII